MLIKASKSPRSPVTRHLLPKVYYSLASLTSGVNGRCVELADLQASNQRGSRWDFPP